MLNPPAYASGWARSRTATKELGEYARRHAIDILLIQEPYARSNRTINLEVKSRKVCVQTCIPWAAIAVLNDNYVVTQISQATTALQATARIKTEDWDIVVVSVYSKVTKTSRADVRRTIRELGHALKIAKYQFLVVGMDANAKSSMWYSNTLDERGEKMEEFIAMHNLRLENTEHGPRGQSNIDIILTNGRNGLRTYDWRVVGDATVSDHNLITWEVGSGQTCWKLTTHTPERRIVTKRLFW